MNDGSREGLEVGPLDGSEDTEGLNEGTLDTEGGADGVGSILKTSKQMQGQDELTKQEVSILQVCYSAIEIFYSCPSFRTHPGVHQWTV